VIPGTSNQYKFRVTLGEGYPLADNKDLEVDLAIWYFPTTPAPEFQNPDLFSYPDAAEINESHCASANRKFIGRQRGY
jgi:hypothetical protein